MSGGYFEHDNFRLNEIAETLDHDIKYNDVHWETPFVDDDGDEHCGFQFSPNALKYMGKMVKDLKRLGDLLHAYDYAVSGDTSLEEFEKMAKKIYGDRC